MGTKRSWTLFVVFLVLTTFAMWAGGGADTSTTTTADEVLPKFANGKVYPLTIANLTNDIALPLTEEKKELTVMFKIQSGRDPEPNNYKDVQYMEERTNVHINWLLSTVSDKYSENYGEFSKAYVAAGQDLPDIIWNHGDGGWLQDLYDAGVIIGLNDLILKYAPDIKSLYDKRPNGRKQMYQPDGQIAGIGRMYHDKMALALKVREDWMQKLNIDMPTNPQEVEEMFDAFVQQDPNGNGEQDEFACYVYVASALDMFFGKLWGSDTTYSNGFLNIDGKLVHKWMLSDAKDYMAFIKKGYTNRWYAPLLVDDPETWWPERGTWSKKPNGMMWAWAYQIKDPTVEDRDKWTAMIPITTKYGPGMYERHPIAQYQYCWMITKDCEDPELAIKWLDYAAYSREGYLLAWGEEGKHWFEKDGMYFLKNKKMMEEEDPDMYEQWTKDYYDIGQRYVGKVGVEDIASWALADPQVRKLYDAILPRSRDGLPAMLPMGAEEQDIFDRWGDSGGGAYMSEMFIKFIKGEEPLENWDQFVAQLKKLGIDEYTAGRQHMWERYNSMD